MQNNVNVIHVTKKSVQIAKSEILLHSTVLKNGVRIESPSPITFKRKIGNPFFKHGVIPIGSLITLKNGTQFKIQSQCEFDFVTGLGMLCGDGYHFF